MCMAISGNDTKLHVVRLTVCLKGTTTTVQTNTLIYMYGQNTVLVRDSLTSIELPWVLLGDFSCGIVSSFMGKAVLFVLQSLCLSSMAYGQTLTLKACVHH